MQLFAYHMSQSFFSSALQSDLCGASFSLYLLLLSFIDPSEHAAAVDICDTTGPTEGTKMPATDARITPVFGVDMCVFSRRIVLQHNI
jgi:hypothetical protein